MQTKAEQWKCYEKKTGWDDEKFSSIHKRKKKIMQKTLKEPKQTKITFNVQKRFFVNAHWKRILKCKIT